MYVKYKIYGKCWRNIYVRGMGDPGGIGCMGGIEIWKVGLYGQGRKVGR